MREESVRGPPWPSGLARWDLVGGVRNRRREAKDAPPREATQRGYKLLIKVKISAHQGPSNQLIYLV